MNTALTKTFRGLSLLSDMQFSFDAVLDVIVIFIVSRFIPFPFAKLIADYFKGPILALLTGILILVVGVGLFIFSILVFPSFWLQNLTGGISGSITDTLAPAIPLEALQGFLDPSFTDTQTPTNDPFGGTGLENAVITEKFHDSGYYKLFGLVHEGVDLIPSDHYYTSNQAYAKVHVPIMFATNTGTTSDYVDSLGALTVDVVNDDKSIKSVYKHLKQILVPNNTHIQAGTPIGVMGATGFAFGEHLHYEVRLNESGTWVAVDPLNYIQ